MKKKKNKESNLPHLIILISILIIAISIAGIAGEKPVSKISAAGASPSKFAESGFNVLSESTGSSQFELFAPTETPTPTPTPILKFKHPILGFSFDVPKNAQVLEMDVNLPHLVENAIAGAEVEIDNLFSAEIGVVSLFGQSLEQYFNNRTSMMFEEKIVDSGLATPSASLQKGYFARAQVEETVQEELWFFLPYRGSQIFEIVGVWEKRKSKAAELEFKKIVESLKPY